MKIENILLGLTFCALAPLTRAQCPQSCEEIFDNGVAYDDIYWAAKRGAMGAWSLA